MNTLHHTSAHAFMIQVIKIYALIYFLKVFNITLVIKQASLVLSKYDL